MSCAIVLATTDGESGRIVYHHLKKHFGDRLGRVVMEGEVPRLVFLKKRIKRQGLFKVLGQVMFQFMIVPYLRRTSAKRVAAIKLQSGLNDAAIPESEVTRVDSINSKRSIEVLRELRPSVVVVNGTRIISGEVLASVPAPFINMHAGITPLYRGVHGGYWALADRNRGACGVTVHMVDKGIDTGAVMGQAGIDPGAEDNFATYPYLQLAAGLPLMREAVEGALAGQPVMRKPPEGKSRLWSHPTFFQYLVGRVRHGVK